MSKQNPTARNLNQPASPFHGPRRFSGQTPSSPTIEQLLNSEATRWSAPTTLPTSPVLARDHDPEEDHTHLHKKSVLAKVKEKAKRWRQNLGKKKQSQEDGNSTPSWGVSLDDDNHGGPDEDDPEYLGAPMYESEMAPAGLKETPRQHPGAVPGISQNQALPSNLSDVTNSQEKENPPNSPKLKANEENKDSVTSPTKTLTESVTEKLAPAYATLSEKTHNIAAKIQSLAVSTPPSDEHHDHQQKYDKGVSVKEYLYQKFEPGEDEKALSKVITEAISPKKSPAAKGVVEKVKEAVSSLLRTEEEAAPSTNSITSAPPSTKTILASSTNNTTPALSTISARDATDSTAKYPSSSYVHEAMEEETHGRILQAN